MARQQKLVHYRRRFNSSLLSQKIQEMKIKITIVTSPFEEEETIWREKRMNPIISPCQKQSHLANSTSSLQNIDIYLSTVDAFHLEGKPANTQWKSKVSTLKCYFNMDSPQEYL